MIEKKIRLAGIHEVKELNALAEALPCDVDLRAGKYYVNAKSLMGIFSLELSGELTLVADTEDEALIARTFAPFLVQRG